MDITDAWQPNGLHANLVRELLSRMNRAEERTLAVMGATLSREDLAAIADTGMPLVRDVEGNAYKVTGRTHMSASTAPRTEWTFPVVNLRTRDRRVLLPPFHTGFAGQMFTRFHEVERA